MYNISDFSVEEKMDLLYCLNERKNNIIVKIQFFNEMVKGRSSYSLEILKSCLLSCEKDLDSVNLLILKVQNLL